MSEPRKLYTGSASGGLDPLCCNICFSSFSFLSSFLVNV